MKIRNIILALVAALPVIVSCKEEDDHYLDEIELSSSYVSLPVAGGSSSITMTTTSSWTLSSTLPDWLTVTPTSGGAGQSTLTFSAAAGEGRTAEISIACDSKVQHINIIQGIAAGAIKATCAEVIAGSDGKTYRVTGVCTAIANTTYGNFYLDDGTGSVYIYGTVNSSGSYAWSSFGIEVGDEVTVEGPRTTYGSTIELVDATFISCNKSLMKVESVDPEDATLPIEGGIFTVTLSNKADGITVSIPEDAQSWLTIQSIDSQDPTAPVVTFAAAANEGGDRGTTLEFSSYKGGKTYSAQTSLTQKGAIVAATIAEFNEAEVGATQYRLSGVVTSIASDKYGNFYLKDFSGETYVYGLADFAGTGIKVGDIITIVGQRGQYKETIEVLNAVLENVTPVTEISIADFLAAEDSKEVYYMVTGTVSEIANATYGNLYMTDGANTVYVYGCYPGYGATGDARKNFLETAGIEVNDILTMIGYKDTYNGTIELCGGIYFSHVDAN